MMTSTTPLRPGTDRGFFAAGVADADPELNRALRAELHR